MLSIRHVTTYTYEPEADRVGLRLKLFPISTPAQRVESWKVTVNGEIVEPLLTNPSGEGEAMWFSRSALEEVEVVAEGKISLDDTAGVLGKFGAPRPRVFLRCTPLTEADEGIRELAAEVEGAGDLDQMHALNALVHERVNYRKAATETSTTAAQALALGAGVCQDLAHVFIATARSMGLPARYVAGYLHQAEEPELATHAWVEVFLDGLGWTGFDPTHEECPATNHVRLCSGYDAADAAPIRGHVTGDIEETLDVSVEIAQSQTQSQQ
ncbi:transglutaminase family protein [Rhodobacteraceae bacterium NNCM2]|nr:transglutaminase family protein [Coraliihabitans acroporae]